MRQTKEAVEIQVPPQNRQEIDTIVKLELDGPAGEIEPIVAASTVADQRRQGEGIERISEESCLRPGQGGR